MRKSYLCLLLFVFLFGGCTTVGVMTKRDFVYRDQIQSKIKSVYVKIDTFKLNSSIAKGFDTELSTLLQVKGIENFVYYSDDLSLDAPLDSEKEENFSHVLEVRCAKRKYDSNKNLMRIDLEFKLLNKINGLVTMDGNMSVWRGMNLAMGKAEGMVAARKVVEDLSKKNLL